LRPALLAAGRSRRRERRHRDRWQDDRFVLARSGARPCEFCGGIAVSTILMVAYTNYRRDPRVRREAEALVAKGHRVVFLACRQPGEADREQVAGVEVRKLPGIRHRRVSASGYIVDYAIFFGL